MKRKDLARELAKQQKMPAAKALDQVDALIHDIVEDLKRKPSARPGPGSNAPASAGPRRGSTSQGSPSRPK